MRCRHGGCGGQAAVNDLGHYSNVIFEMWNEPDDGTDTATSPEATAYFSYVVEMYRTIRATGNMNLIFMQWHASLTPGKTELDWVPQMYHQLKDSVGSTPSNVAFTAHPYRRAPYPNLEWANHRRRHTGTTQLAKYDSCNTLKRR